jgi:hypothetical protein
MFTLWGNPNRFCDKVDRRAFLRLGGLGIAGLSLADVLRLRASAPSAKPARSVILICLAGGPSHLDMYDLKPDAPVEIRGEFKPIRTNVPGFEICEHFPEQAKITDKLALVRTLQFIEPMGHELEEVFTGFPKSMQRPSFGAVISKFKGGDGKLPPYVSLQYGERTHSYESPQYIGAAHRPLQVVGTAGVRNLSLPHGVTRARLDDRRGLLEAFDSYRREIDTSDESRSIDAFTVRAFDIVTSAKARDAFDLSREPDKVLARYGKKDGKYIYAGAKAESPWDSQQFLLARRLVEAGVPVVTMIAGMWDHHGALFDYHGGTIFQSLKSTLPFLDRSIHALVTDLHERGLDREVLVVVMGEFGRTPKLSKNGRDHWPDASFALFAGGGLKMGQVVGETDSHGARPKRRGFGAQNVLATIYEAMGIDLSISVPDFTGRPMYLLDDREPVAELV